MSDQDALIRELGEKVDAVKASRRGFVNAGLVGPITDSVMARCDEADQDLYDAAQALVAAVLDRPAPPPLIRYGLKQRNDDAWLSPVSDGEWVKWADVAASRPAPPPTKVTCPNCGCDYETALDLRQWKDNPDADEVVSRPAPPQEEP